MPDGRFEAGSCSAFCRAERVLHERTGLACAAAAGVTGRFRVWEVSGVRAVLATEPSLAFLATVSGVDPVTVHAAVKLVDSGVWHGVTPVVLVAVNERGEVVARLRAAGLVPRLGPAVAVKRLDATTGSRAAGRHDVVDGHDVDEFLGVLLAGYQVEGPVAAFIAAEHSQSMVRRFVVVDEQGTSIAAGAMTLHGDVAVLGGASTVPGARGQGAQSLLINHRMRLAAQAGCRWAVATAMPNSVSAQNLRRAGFHLYLRSAWSKAHPAA